MSAARSQHDGEVDDRLRLGRATAAHRHDPDRRARDRPDAPAVVAGVVRRCVHAPAIRQRLPEDRPRSLQLARVHDGSVWTGGSAAAKRRVSILNTTPKSLTAPRAPPNVPRVMARTILRHASAAVHARDAGVRRLRRLTVGAAVLGAAGTVVLGGAAAVDDPGRPAPANTPVAQTASSAPTGVPTDPPVTDGSGQRHHRASTPVVPGLVPPVITGGQPGSGLVTSGGS